MSQQLNEIIGLLQSQDPGEQREGAFLARDGQQKEAVPYLVPMLQSSSIGAQEAADMALRKIGGAESVKGLIPLLRSDSAAIRNLAMDILRHIGHQDLESLFELLGDQDPDIRIFAADILGASGSYLAVTPLCELLLKDQEVNVRYQAAVSLGELGRVEAATCLNQAFQDEEWVQYAVVEALSKLRDDSSLQALMQALSNSSELVCSMIVDALGEVGHIKSVPMLLKRMETAPAVLRNKIVKAIIRILGGKGLNFLSPKEKEKLSDYLLVAIEDNDPDVQDASILGLGYVGGSKASKKILQAASRMDPEHEEERLEQAQKALVSIGFNQALVQPLFSENETVSGLAIQALGGIGCKESVHWLIQAFEDKPRDLQREIAKMLYFSAGEESRDFFIKNLKEHRDGDVLKHSLRFLGYKLQDQESLSILLRFLEHPWDDVKETALESVLAIGGDSVREYFYGLFSSQEVIKRLMAVYALGKMGAAENIEYLMQALNDESPEVRKIALEALTYVCPEDENTLSRIVQGLYDEERDVRRSVVELLDTCPHKDTVHYLVQALWDPDEWVKIRAIEALGRKEVYKRIPDMLSMWDRSSKLVKIKIIQALGNIGGHTAFRALLDILDDADPELQDAAEKALDKLQEHRME